MTSKTLDKLRWWMGVAGTLVLGLITFGLALYGLGPHDSWQERWFNAAALLTLEPVAPDSASVASAHPDVQHWTLDLARFFAPLVALGAATTVLTILFSLSRTLQDSIRYLWIAASSRRRPRHAHAVVIGLGRIGMQLVRDLRSPDAPRRDESGGARNVIVLEPDEDHPEAEEARRLGALVLLGDAREQRMRRRAHLDLAREVFIAGDDDALNVNIAGELSQQERYQQPLQCYVHVGEPGFSEVFRAYDLLRGKGGAVDFHPFNVHAHAARQLLIGADPLAPEHGLARQYAPSEDEVAYYILYGFGEMGQTVALHMARLAHFKNLRRLRLTIIDDFDGDAQVRKARQCFLDRHPGFCPDLSFELDDHTHRDDPDKDEWSYRGARPYHKGWRFDDPAVVEYAVNAEFLDMPTEVDAPKLMRRLGQRLAREQRPPVKAAVVVCFDDDRRNFEAALRVREALRQLPDEQLPSAPIPTYAFLQDEEGLSSLLHEQPAGAAPFPLHVFGEMNENAGYRHVVRPTIRELAAGFHAAYAELQGGRAGENVDLAAVYAALSPAFKQSNEDAAAHAYIKLDAVDYHVRQQKNGEKIPVVTFTPGQVEVLSHIEHNRWMAERLVAGWRYGPRDDQRRRRLSFRPWEHLPEADRAKDESQIQVLASAFQKAGKVVSRPLSAMQTETAATAPAAGDGQRRAPSSPGGTMQ